LFFLVYTVFVFLVVAAGAAPGAIAAMLILIGPSAGLADEKDAARKSPLVLREAPPPDSAPLAAFVSGWRKTVKLPDIGADREPSRCSAAAWVEDGWLVVERRDVSGDIEWQIVLAKINESDEPPKMAPTPNVPGGLRLDFRDGQFFIHDDVGNLRCLRQRKSAAEKWPVLAIPKHEPDPAVGGASNAGERTYYHRIHRGWQFIAGGLGGELAEFVLRMKHPEVEEIRGVSISFNAGDVVQLRVDGPPEFSGRLPALATVLDDGELLVVNRVRELDVDRERAARLAREKLAAERERLLGAPPAEVSASQWIPRAYGWDELKGKVVLVYYAGDFLRVANSRFNSPLKTVEVLHQRYCERGLEVVAIAAPNQAPSYAEFIQERKLPFPVAIDDGQTASRFVIETVSRGGPLPSCYLLIGRDGKLARSHYSGPLPIDEVQELLRDEAE
jgi:hypothetical protein